MRVGMGYDVHKLVEDRKLILGGVEIPHTLGLLGHSDADVLVHAIMDALLGAAALGDIGKHFPDTDPQYAGISSMKLLAHVRDLIMNEGYVIENIDATVIAQKPKLRPYIDEMEKNIADTLGIALNQINIKAHRSKCHKSRFDRIIRLNYELTSIHKEVLDNLNSIHGALLRINRSIQSEGTYGEIKANRGYERFRRRGINKVILEIALISCGFNLHKYHLSKLAKANPAKAAG